MSPLQNLTDDELHNSAIAAARRDQAATLITIDHLEEVARRLLHAKRGYSSVHEYAVKALGFSEPAAAERVAAMRLQVAVPGTKEKLQSGELTLSSAAAVQRFIRREEKLSDRRFTPEEKKEMVQQVSGCSVQETRKALLTFALDPEPHLLRERIRPVTPTRTELTFYAGSELMRSLERFKELKGNLSLEEIFAAALGDFLDRNDPGRKKLRIRKSLKDLPGSCRQEIDLTAQATRTSEWEGGTSETGEAARPSRYVSIPDHLKLHERSGGRCEYVDPKAGRRCESRFRLQPDHRIPFAKGGPSEFPNLRHYCPTHNKLAAVNAFGLAKMTPFLRT